MPSKSPSAASTAAAFRVLTCGGCDGAGSTWRRRPAIMRVVKTTESKAAAAVRIRAGLGQRKRSELLGLMRPSFARVEPWLQAGKYVGAVMSGLPNRNGWTVARHVGDRTPGRPQRLLNRAAWDTFAAMGVVRRFAVAGLDEAARRPRRRGGGPGGGAGGG